MSKYSMFFLFIVFFTFSCVDENDSYEDLTDIMEKERYSVDCEFDNINVDGKNVRDWATDSCFQVDILTKCDKETYKCIEVGNVDLEEIDNWLKNVHGIDYDEEEEGKVDENLEVEEVDDLEFEDLKGYHYFQQNK